MNRLLSRWTAATLLEVVVSAVLLLASLGVPLLLLMVELQFERGTLASMAASRAYTVTQRIAANPQMWRFEEVRLKELVVHSVIDGDAADRRSILDADGQMLVESRGSAQLPPPVVAVRAPLHDAGRVAGWLVIERSIRPLVQRTVWITLTTLALCAALLAFLKWLPLRALRRVERELEHKAFHDDLTGLFNRDAFRRLLGAAVVHAARADQSLAVLFIDLDRFKSINDTLGHDAGDEVLCAVAERLRACVRAGDVVARLSGDEFAIVIEDLASDAQAGQAADSLLARFEAPFTVRGRDWHLSCSVGLSLFPKHAREPDKLLAFADTAMLHAKGSGRSARSLYSDDMQESVARRVHIEDDLRGALERGEFELHYQPLVDLRSARIRGVEALIRWRHPARGLVPPVEFIPVLEDMGLIHAVGQWVLLEASRQMHEWLAAGHDLRWVSVNVSALQFGRERDFVDQVSQALADSGLQPRYLQLELTEAC